MSTIRHSACAGVLALCLWTATSSLASTPATEPAWLRLDLPSLVLFSSTDAATLEDLGHNLLALRQALQQLSPQASFETRTPTYVFAFPDEASFRPYALDRSGSGFVGYLVPYQDGAYGAINLSGGQSPLKTLYKQAAQQFFYRHLPTLPDWFLQGLTELYSTFAVINGVAMIGLPEGEARLAELPPHLRTQQPPVVDSAEALAAVLRRDQAASGDWDELTTIAYLQTSGRLVHYLTVDSEARREQTRSFIRLLATGSPAQAAFQEAYQVTPEDLVAELVEHIKEHGYSHLEIRLKAPARAQPPHPVAQPDLLYHLGDLLNHMDDQHAAQAQQHFQAALALAPDHGLALAGLGELAYRLQDYPQAQQHLERAVALLPDDAGVHYLYGASLLQPLINQRPQTPEQLAVLAQAREQLVRSTELDPNLPGAWERLSYAYNLEPKPLPGAVAACQRALELQPERSDITFNLLVAEARTGNRDGVAAARERLAQQNATADLLDRATQGQLQLDFALATGLMRQNRLADASAWLAHVHAHSTNPVLRQQAEEWIARVEAAEASNHFARDYHEARRLAQEGQAEEAAALAGQLLAGARPGPQTEIAQQLQRELAELSPAPLTPAP